MSSLLLLIAVIAFGAIGLVGWIFDKRRRAEQQRAALRKAATDLRDFVAHANAYRPKFITRFLHLLMSFFPRDYEGTSDGPDPEPWVTTVDNLLVPKAH